MNKFLNFVCKSALETENYKTKIESHWFEFFISCICGEKYILTNQSRRVFFSYRLHHSLLVRLAQIAIKTGVFKLLDPMSHLDSHKSYSFFHHLSPQIAYVFEISSDSNIPDFHWLFSLLKPSITGFGK